MSSEKTQSECAADIPPAAAEAAPATESSSPPLVAFKCHLCQFQQTCEYYGDRPPFAPTNKFPEKCYIKKDPFAPPPKGDRPSAEYLLVLGADCTRCAQTTCWAPECSIFYKATTCLQCAKANIEQYPLEIKTKIKKQLKAIE